MSSSWTTLTEFLLKEEQQIPQATGSLTLLLNQIVEGSKIIASHVKKSGLIDIQGATGARNTFDEEVQKLDEFSNTLLIDMLRESGQVVRIGSEELEDLITVKGSKGKYDVFMDPLDGSSNIDVNAPIGTIFSVYRTSNDFQPGSQQVAAGYVLYGSSTMLVYSCSEDVHGFTLDPSVGSFLLSHPRIRMPAANPGYSVNEGYWELFGDDLKKYLSSIKQGDKPYQSRYIGTLIADMHRTLLKGGIFMNPANKQKPNGKLRLLYEVNPFAMLAVRAGGRAVSTGGTSPLDIIPSSVSQRVPIVMGSADEVEKYLTFTAQ